MREWEAALNGCWRSGVVAGLSAFRRLKGGVGQEFWRQELRQIRKRAATYEASVPQWPQWGSRWPGCLANLPPAKGIKVHGAGLWGDLWVHLRILKEKLNLAPSDYVICAPGMAGRESKCLMRAMPCILQSGHFSSEKECFQWSKWAWLLLHNPTNNEASASVGNW